ncbi:MAG TPA: alpha/beta fold hydrolase [Azospirillaceae bacterium]|nr:alpha/beta fold hydrolase [Azospirillaceae bacterium]
MSVLTSWPAGLTLSRSSSPPWRPELRERAASLRRDLAGVDPEAFERAVEPEARRRADRLLTGLERYRRHPYRRDLDDPPPVWTEGRARITAFGPEDGPPVLFVPSLVNRGYILDLSSRKSLVRWLAARGLRCFLIDWGAPGPEERRFTLSDYVAGRLRRAIQAARALSGGRRVGLVGYCMGGLLTAAAAQRQPEDVAALGLMATPWDFHAEDRAGALRVAACLPALEPALRTLGELPIDMIQALFAGLDPLLAMKKFSSFARKDPESDDARDFVALEDWLNDGVTLAEAVARECIAGWYGRNDTGRGDWRVAGEPVIPARIRVPALALVPAMDRIVPPASARALGQAIPGCTILEPPLGHIGMIVSGGAQPKVWEPLAQWLLRTVR